MRAALERVEGAYAICVLIDGVRDQIIAARHDAPLILGVGEGENYVASDIPAILNRTRDMIFLEENELAVVTRRQRWRSSTSTATRWIASRSASSGTR